MEVKPAILLLPVGPVEELDKEEIDAMLRQARKATGLPVEIGAEVKLPPGASDTARGQIVAGKLLVAVPAIVEPPPRPFASSPYGAGLEQLPPAPPPSKSEADFAHVAIADQDLFAPGQDFVFSLADSKGHRAVVALRRLRESYYKRKADPARQRSRAAKEFIAAVGAARGIPPCEDPHCVMSRPRTVLDIDRKNDRFCGACNNQIHGRMRW